MLALAAAVGDIKLDPVFPCRAASSTSQSFVERTDQVDLLNKPGTQSQPKLPNSGKSCIESDNNIPQNQINISSLSAKVEQCNEKPFGNAVNFRDPSELSLDSRSVFFKLTPASFFCQFCFNPNYFLTSSRLKQTVEQKTSDFGRKPENSVELVSITRQV